MKAVEILITLGDFHLVLQLLNDSSLVDCAALFAIACIEKGLLIEPMSNDIQMENKNELKKNLFIKENNYIPLEQLLQSIYLDYAYVLYTIENINAAKFYW